MIRDGIKEDSEKIAILKIDNWRKTYSKIFPEDFLNNLSLTKEKEKYLNNLKNKNVIIYEKEKEPIAYCYYGENTKYKDYQGEVFALYVKNNCQERGIGTKLLQYAIKDLANKSNKIFLWCAKENTRAISFYQKNGFKIIGEEIENIGGKNVEKVALGINAEADKFQGNKSEYDKLNEKNKENNSEDNGINEQILKDKYSGEQVRDVVEKNCESNIYILKKSVNYIENEQCMAIYANPDLIFLKDEPRNWFMQIINHKKIIDIPKKFINYLLKKEIIEKYDNYYCSNL